MTNPSHLDPVEEMPPELAELDRELSELLLEERPSFGPELRNELARAWARSGTPARPAWVRHALAASVAAVAFAGLAVPPARASLVIGVQRILETFREPPPELPARPLPPLSDVPGSVRDAAPVAGGEVGTAVGRAAVSDGAVPDLPPFRPGASAPPTLRDESAGRSLVRNHYPDVLQRRGVGGVVSLLLWVNEDGTVDHVQMSRGSGVDELDRAALAAAPELRFRPAVRSGLVVGTWVEFDVVFEPSPGLVRPVEPEVLATPMIPEVEGWLPPESWSEAAVVPAPILVESREMLRAAMARPEAELEEMYGPLDGILNGDAPRGRDPVEWRESVTGALDAARVRDPENPAPYLALARIRRSQGLRNDARLLFDEGLRRAAAGTRPVSPRLVAELAYESGRLSRETWLGWRDLGDLPSEALASSGCPGAVPSAGPVASMETVLSWNYSCPAALGPALAEGFRPRSEGNALRSAMVTSFMTAVEAYPAHVGANTEILLDLADREAWQRLLEGASRFERASRGHPNALLLEGLALHRLGRSEEARDRFRGAMEQLPPNVAADFRGAGLLPGDAVTRGEGDPWDALDPILSTEVNERRVEHWSRAAYAFLRFGSLDADAARVWIRYGRPDAMRSLGAGPGLRLEMWDYGQGPDVTFHRPAASQNGALTPEAEEYLRELEGAVPHWYGTRARRLYALPAQVAQFSGSREGSVEMSVGFQVPAEFRAPGTAGPLQVGVFLLGGDGTPMERLRWSIPRDRARTEALVPAGPGVEQVVVEVYDAETGMAAAARRRVVRDASRVSDLLMTLPPESGVPAPGRRGEGTAILAAASLGADDAAGVFFEVYGAEVGTAYQVSARLVPDAGGPAIPLEIRPWDERRAAEAWTRTAVGPEASPELLELGLRSVGPGTYTLEVRVELDDGGVVVSRRPGLERRESGEEF